MQETSGWPRDIINWDGRSRAVSLIRLQLKAEPSLTKRNKSLLVVAICGLAAVYVSPVCYLLLVPAKSLPQAAQSQPANVEVKGQGQAADDYLMWSVTVHTICARVRQHYSSV